MAICIVVYRADGRGRRFRYVLDRAEFVIGRGDVADLRLPDPAVSLNHARICRQEDRLMITDLGSRNGSVVGGAPLAEGQSVAWEFGQQLAIGPYLLCHERDVPSVEASEAVEADGTAMLARMMVEEVLGDQAQAHSLVVIAGPNLGQWLQIAARDGEATIGRGQEATLQLSDADVSRIHARLVSDRQGMLWLEDLHSKNGVRIGGESISERVTVTTGDEISLGQTVLRYGETVDVYLESLSRQEPLPLLQAGVPGNVSQVVARPSSSSSSPRGDSSPVDRTTWFVFGGLLLGVIAAALYLLF